MFIFIWNDGSSSMTQGQEERGGTSSGFPRQTPQATRPPHTCTPRMPKMMKKAQQMTTMLPMGLREDISVSTTSFSPWARLMTLESRGRGGEYPGTPTTSALLGLSSLPPSLTLACCPSTLPCQHAVWKQVPLITEPPPRGRPPSAVSKEAPEAPTSPPPLSGYQVYFLIRLGVKRTQPQGGITRDCRVMRWGCRQTDSQETVVGACREGQGRGDGSLQRNSTLILVSSPLWRNSELGGWNFLTGEGRSPARRRVSRDDPRGVQKAMVGECVTHREGKNITLRGL